MSHRSPARKITCLIALAAACAAAIPAAVAATRPTATVTVSSRLIAIRAAHRPGLDRIVFQFAGPPPSRRSVRYISRLVADPSGRPVRIAGRAILEAGFAAATAHGTSGTATAPGRIAFALPNVITAVRAGDFESVLSYGIGLAKRTAFRVSELAHPSRVVIDISTPFQTVLKRVYFENLPRFASGTEPYVTPVLRRVLRSAPATGVMDRLMAGPTPAEYASGLRLQRSRATGFTGPSIAQLIARVRLTGSCASGGSTFTVASEIFPTLRQFATVRFVKIYDPAGHTERPTGPTDSIPFCLEP